MFKLLGFPFTLDWIVTFRDGGLCGLQTTHHLGKIIYRNALPYVRLACQECTGNFFTHKEDWCGTSRIDS